ALGDPAERRVLIVQEMGGPEHDVDLAARRVRILGAGHAEDAPIERPLVELALDRVARAAGADPGIGYWHRHRLEIANLHHYARLHAVHALSVIEALAHEVEEVLHV